MRTWTCLGILLAVLAVPATAAAQRDQSHDEEARALFEAGRTAFEAGRFDAALQHFQSAYDLSGRPELLYNIGSAADRLRMDDKALDAFQQYLQKVPNAPNRSEVESRVAVLKRAVAARKAAAKAEAEQAASHGSGGGGTTAAATSGSTETAPPTEHAAEAPKKTVPTPKEAAQAAQPEAQSTQAPSSPEPEQEHKGGVVHKWWFWTIIGVVAVGAAVGAGVAVASSGGNTPVYQGQTQPNVIYALRAR